jgi:hypothetical protein
MPACSFLELSGSYQRARSRLRRTGPAPSLSAVGEKIFSCYAGCAQGAAGRSPYVSTGRGVLLVLEQARSFRQTDTKGRRRLWRARTSDRYRHDVGHVVSCAATTALHVWYDGNPSA